MELEFFCKPGTDLEWFSYWKNYCLTFLNEVGLPTSKVRFRDHEKEELSFYSNATTDIEFEFLFGWGELWGIADRTDYDLRTHQTHSKENLEYFDPDTNTKYLPYVIEPSLGVERLLLAILTSAWEEETLPDGETRDILHLHPALAPFKAAVLPLTNKLSTEAKPSIVSFPNTSWLIMIRVVKSGNVIVVKMRWVPLIASPLILIL
jgi:glycyl-tRNA synthetase